MAREEPKHGYVARIWAKYLHHPCCLGGPQHLSRGLNHKRLGSPHVGTIATSPLLSEGSPTLTRGLNQKWLGGPHVVIIATSPLLSRGSPTLVAGTKSQTCWPACGQNSYITPAFLGVPNAPRGE